MIERVARAMFACDHDEPWEQGEDLTRRIYLNNARAAIEAMREPSDAMLQAATMEVPTWDDAASKRKWQAMITAALEGE